MSDIVYVLNDPTTPSLVIPVDLPPKPSGMDFSVNGFNGPTTTMYTLEHQAAMCHYSLVQAINLMRKHLNNASLSHWSSVRTLAVEPRAGRQLNAFYDRQGLKFFYAMDPVTKNMVYAVNSSDVVLHETGHALLDALRPDLYNVQAYEVWGFHEAFGDIHSIINALQHEEFIDFVLNETKGDIAQSNSLSKLAEEMGQAIYDATGGRGGRTAGVLRDAFNSFTYTEPEKLSRSGNDNQITSEPHSFSRIFTGAWYEILCGIYKIQRDAHDPKTALIAARDILTSYTFNSIAKAPATIRFYDSFARAILMQDKLNNSIYNKVINDTFVRRGILRPSIRPMAAINWSDCTPMPDDEIISDSKASVIRGKNIEILTLPDFMVNVEVPNDSYYEFDDQGSCIHNPFTTATELIDHARNCVDFLHEKGLIRPDSSTPFEITHDGNLVRSHFAGCFLNNCTDPGQIEFLRCWKGENNSGCGCGGKKKPTCSNKGPSSIMVANTRLQTSGCGFSKINSAQNVNFNFSKNAKSRVSC